MLPPLTTLALDGPKPVATGSGRWFTMTGEEETWLTVLLEKQERAKFHGENTAESQTFSRAMDELAGVFSTKPRLAILAMGRLTGLEGRWSETFAAGLNEDFRQLIRLAYVDIERLDLMTALLLQANRYPGKVLALLAHMANRHPPFLWEMVRKGAIQTCVAFLTPDHENPSEADAIKLLKIFMNHSKASYDRNKRFHMRAKGTYDVDAPLDNYANTIVVVGGVEPLVRLLKWSQYEAEKTIDFAKYGVNDAMAILTTIVRIGNQLAREKLIELHIVELCVAIVKNPTNADSATGSSRDLVRLAPELLDNLANKFRKAWTQNMPFNQLHVLLRRAGVYELAVSKARDQYWYDPLKWMHLLLTCMPECAQDIMGAEDGRGVAVLTRLLTVQDQRTQDYNHTRQVMYLSRLVRLLFVAQPGAAHEKFKDAGGWEYLWRVVVLDGWNGPEDTLKLLLADYLANEEQLHWVFQGLEFARHDGTSVKNLVTMVAPRRYQPRDDMKLWLPTFKRLCGIGSIWNLVSKLYERVESNELGDRSMGPVRPDYGWAADIEWDWNEVTKVLHDYPVLVKAAIDNPEPSLPAALMLVLKIEAELRAEDFPEPDPEPDPDEQDLFAEVELTPEELKVLEMKKRYEAIALRRLWLEALPKIRKLHERSPLWGAGFKAIITRVESEIMRPSPNNPWHEAELAEWGEMMADVEQAAENELVAQAPGGIVTRRVRAEAEERARKRRRQSTDVALVRFQELNRAHLLLGA